MSDMQMVLKAASFAANKHRNQRRKDVDASPYINHPLALAQVLADHGVTDPVALCAALLHDTLEDTETTREELVREFGEEIAAIVVEVTDDKSLPKVQRKRLQAEHAAHLTDRSKRVKLADKICNLRDIASAPPADWDLVRKREYFEWAKGVIDGLRGVDRSLEALFDEVYGMRP